MDGYEDYHRGFTTADKDLKCNECDRPINAGDRFERATGTFDGEEHVHHTCVICAEIAEAFCCDGRSHGSLWDDLETTIDQDASSFTTACFSKLSTAAARREVQSFWMKVIGLP